jgi:Uma2 family endonuclease
MMAAPSRLHQTISRKLLLQLGNFLRGKTCEVFNAPFEVYLNFDKTDEYPIMYQPDIFVICDESKHDGNKINGAPDFIIEILSPFNKRHDKNTKFRHYQRFGVKEYWIVDPVEKSVIVYILKDGKYGGGTIYRDDDIIPVYSLKGCEINLAEIFHDVTINEDMLPKKLIEALKAKGMSDDEINEINEIMLSVYQGNDSGQEQ